MQSLVELLLGILDFSIGGQDVYKHYGPQGCFIVSIIVMTIACVIFFALFGSS